MKLLNYVLFAGLALSASFAHAGGSCKDTAGYKLGTDVSALQNLSEPSAPAALKPNQDSRTGAGR